MLKRFLLLMFGSALSVNVQAKVDLVKVVKSTNTMHLYQGETRIKTYHVALGGDPEGHYILDYVKEDSAYYRAMHISYPNQQDLDHADKLGVSAGGFIMIHGQKNGLGWLSSITQQFNWTDGCIALTNSEMDEFLSLEKKKKNIQTVWE